MCTTIELRYCEVADSIETKYCMYNIFWGTYCTTTNILCWDIDKVVGSTEAEYSLICSAQIALQNNMVHDFNDVFKKG